MAEKIINYIKTHLLVVCGITVAVIALIVAIALLSGNDSETAEEHEWGDGITDNIPEFSGTPESFDFGSDGSYAAAYYSGVTSEQVSEYIVKLESKLEIDFSSDKYPCSAVCGEKIIVIHYNVTEMRFSVTVTAKTNTFGE